MPVKTDEEKAKQSEYNRGVADALRLAAEWAAKKTMESVQCLSVEKVVWSGPATIILWSDNTKTVVRCQGDDQYDPEKGVMAAVLKRILGNTGSYNDIINYCMQYYHGNEHKKKEKKKSPADNADSLPELDACEECMVSCDSCSLCDVVSSDTQCSDGCCADGCCSVEAYNHDGGECNS